jgi:hypothetical protein
MLHVLELDADVMRIILFHVGSKFFSFHPMQPAEPPRDLLKLTVVPDSGRWAPEKEIDWPMVTWTSFEPRTAYNVAYEEGEGRARVYQQIKIKEQYYIYRQALKELATMSATCRAWSAVLVSHWRGIYETMEKFLPFILHGQIHALTRELAMPAGPSARSRLSDAWFRLALKYVCKDGVKMAKREITLKRYTHDPERKRGLKPGTLYLARSRRTQLTTIKRGRDVEDDDVVEHTLTEKEVDGKKYWRHKTMPDVDAALDRQRQIRADTRALQNALRKEGRDYPLFGREL